MLIEISVGELVDKICILELKQKCIKDTKKLKEANKEFNSLLKYSHYITGQLFFYNLLYYVNEQIWLLTNDVKKINFNSLNDEYSVKKYANLTNNIFVLNQKRFRLKKIFDMIYSSDIKEQKSYSELSCKILVDNEETILDKIAEINYLLLEYDYIIFDNLYTEKINTIFKCPTIIN